MHPAASLGAATLALAVLIVGSPPRAASAQEVRGFWADGFNPGIKSKEEVDTLLSRLQRAGCNAIFAQVRKHGDAYYFSRYEPLAVDNRTGWDPLRYLIEKAHAATPPIAVHAWINTCAVGGPFAPGHLLAQYPAWRSLSDTGESYDNEAVKIDPGVPEAAEWTYRVYMDVARSYDVDGIHFDFVRYGGARWGYAPVSVARFNARCGRQGTPAWNDPLWQQWRRDQVTALVRKVYANAVAVKPRIIVSGALISWGDGPRSEADWTKTSAYRSVYQDWRAWLEEGILDLGCPMTYFASHPHRSFQEHWAEWIKEHQYRRAAALAVGAWLNPLPETLELIRINQAPSAASGKKAAGTLLYSYKGTNALTAPDGKRREDAYNETVYDTLPQVFPGALPFPQFPWKTHPTRGHLKGSVLAGSRLLWADGAQVTLEGKGMKRTQAAGGTGFFAFIDLTPGPYTITATYQGETSAPRTVVVMPGEVASADFLLASGGLPAPRPVKGISEEKQGVRVLLQARPVTVGTDVLGDRFFVADRVGGPPLEIRPPQGLFMPLVRDDLATLTGTLRVEAGRTALIADAVQVVGSRPL